jgi:hypothetical protein
LLEVVADEGVAYTSGAEDDFGELVGGGHGGDLLIVSRYFAKLKNFGTMREFRNQYCNCVFIYTVRSTGSNASPRS